MIRRNPLPSLLTIFLTALLAVTLSACDDSIEEPLSEDDFNTAERITFTDGLGAFESELKEEGIFGDLTEGGPYTIFATTLGDIDPSALSGEQVPQVLELHIIEGQRLGASDLSDGDQLETRSGDNLNVSVVDGTPLINGAPVVNADLPANNGVVHVIGRTLLSNQSLVTRVSVSGATATLNAAVAAGGEGAPDLSQDDITVFAPENAAFEEFFLDPAEDGLLGNPSLLNEVLGYHVVPQELSASDLVANGDQTYTTAAGEDIDVTIDDGTVLVNDAEVTTPNLQGTNGVVHLINAQEERGVEGVLTRDIFSTQDRLQFTNSLQTLFAAAGIAGADLSSGGPFTVFAPRNEAFGSINLENLTGENPRFTANQALAQKLVNYHVLPQELSSGDLVENGTQSYTTAEGSDLEVSVVEDDEGNVTGVEVDSQSVNLTDVNASNGVLHYVDAAPLQTHLNIPERALVLQPFATLADAAIVTGRDAALENPGPFTVISPTNEAFGNLPAGVATDLLENETGLLGEVLDYHVLDGESTAQDIVDQVGGTMGEFEVQTRQGQNLTFTLSEEETLLADGIEIVEADLAASNGLLHAVAEAPLTPTVNAVETAVLNGFLQLRNALEGTDLRGTLASTDPVTVLSPSNAAFEAYLEEVGANSIERLTQDELDALEERLQYHVIDQELTAEDIQNDIEMSSDGEVTVGTLQGEDLTFTLGEDGTLLVNGSPIGPADLEATNGVLHGLDGILEIPESE